jgi:hypothetical protein
LAWIFDDRQASASFTPSLPCRAAAKRRMRTLIYAAA